jgi:hypothetical protein
MIFKRLKSALLSSLANAAMTTETVNAAAAAFIETARAVIKMYGVAAIIFARGSIP